MKAMQSSLLIRVVNTVAVSILIIGRIAFADALDNWTITQVSTNSFHLSDVVYGNGLFVAAGGRSDYGAIMTSEDGFNWILRTGPGVSVPPSLVWGLTYGGGRFVAVGHFGGTGSSTNGIDWSFSSVSIVGLYGVAYGASKYVAVGGGSVSNIFTSTDGINWAPRRSHPSESHEILDVAYGSGTFVAIGGNDGFSYTSPNGTTWTRRNIPGGNSITYLNNLFMVPFGAGTNLLSSDGTNWAALPTGISSEFGRIGYANSVYVALSGSFRAYTNVLTSTDGTNWVYRTTQSLYSREDIEGANVHLASDGRRFVAVGTDGTGFGNYNAKVMTSDALVNIGVTNASPPQITLSGLVGRSYRIESLDAFAPTGSDNWQTNAVFQLPASPYLWTDPTSSNSTQRFYRAALLP